LTGIILTSTGQREIFFAEPDAALVKSNMQILLIRHGQSQANVGQSDHPDCDLTAMGLEQAHEVGRQLAERDLSGFIALVSPYCRARRTADAIAEATGLRFSIEPQIREWGKDCRIDGDWYPEETREELRLRMSAFYQQIRGGKYILVCHAAPIAALMHVASGQAIPPEGEFWADVPNGCLLRLEAGGQHLEDHSKADKGRRN
jgi:broad specificity phosphatase PhoE